ncbi:MAG TPA: SigE family RNA polymerase sigma factor [Candidatus Limnocylindrales bacterium]
MPVTTGTKEFAEFYAASYSRIAGQLYAYLGDLSEAQDVTQEAFCRAFDRWTTISSYDHPEAWVRQVAWNLATNRLRHLRVAMRYLARQREEHVDGPTPDRVALVRALAKLPPNHRLAIVLHHIGQLSTAEIAEQQQVAEATVRSWLSRGRNQLAGHLTDSGVPRKRALHRPTLAAVLATALALSAGILLYGKYSEPPIIGPTEAPASPSPSPSPSPFPSPSPALAAPPISACTGALLPNLSGGSGGGLHLSGGDPTGRYLVGTNVRYDVPQRAAMQPVLWTDGKASTISAPGPTPYSVEVNSGGVLAGASSRDGKTGFSVWTYRDGQFHTLHQTDDPNQARGVVAINARGDVLVTGIASLNKTPLRPSIILAGQDPVLRDLPIPAGAQEVYVSDLDDNGTVVGAVNYPGGSINALVWAPDLTFRELPGLDGWDAQALRVRGEWVVGAALKGRLNPEQRPLRWNLRTGEVQEFAALRYASSVTPQGWILGVKGDQPVVIMGGKQLELPRVDGRTWTKDFSFNYISDDGRVIAGSGNFTSSHEAVAIRWTCS